MKKGNWKSRKARKQDMARRRGVMYSHRSQRNPETGASVGQTIYDSIVAQINSFTSRKRQGNR